VRLSEQPLTIQDLLKFPRNGFAVNFDINNGCQLRCVMCRPETSPGFHDQAVLPEDRFKELVPVIDLAQHYQFGCLSEPTMVPYFEQAIEMLPPGEKGRMNTNGMLLTEGKIKAIAESGKFQMLKISCDGCTKETFEKIRVRGVFKTVTKHIEKAASLLGSGRVGIVFTLQQGNAHELGGVVNLAADLGVGLVIIHFRGDQMEWACQQSALFSAARQVAVARGISFMESGQMAASGRIDFPHFALPACFQCSPVPLFYVGDNGTPSFVH
jgi:MoaA/NifB/PqqE/SkfB family radical SAM enzyme